MEQQGKTENNGNSRLETGMLIGNPDIGGCLILQ